MKKALLISIVLFFFIFTYSEAESRYSSFSYGYFYSSLKPYGEWIQIDVDLIVWRPTSVHFHWKPYSIGRWSWTKHGWYWDSYELFGWATYHYGRWYYDDYYGWIWIPDDNWGPAWVEWRYNDDYIGWAPLPPYVRFSINIGIHFSINWHSHYTYWNFVLYKNFYDYRVSNYFLDSRRSYKIFERTKYRTNYYTDRDRIMNGGLDRSFIERKAGYRIGERDIYEVDDLTQVERTRSARSVERIYSYKPSEKDFTSSRNLDNYEIKKSDNRTSLDKDKIVISRENIFNNREVESSRAVERKRNDIKTEPYVKREEIKKEEFNWQRNEKEMNRAEPRKQVETSRFPEFNYKREEPKQERSREVQINRNKVRENNASRNIDRKENRSENDSRPDRGRTVERKK